MTGDVSVPRRRPTGSPSSRLEDDGAFGYRGGGCVSAVGQLIALGVMQQVSDRIAEQVELGRRVVLTSEAAYPLGLPAQGVCVLPKDLLASLQHDRPHHGRRQAALEADDEPGAGGGWGQGD